MEYILAIDQGTTGTTALVMDKDLNEIAQASMDFPQHFPQPGWVEHDVDDIWKSVLHVIQKVTQNIKTQQILAIGITNQRETLCFWDRHTGESLANAIVWQDRRTSEICQKLKEEKLEPFFQDATGLLLDPYFSGTKAVWALENHPQVQSAYKKGRLAVGTMDSYLLMKLTGGRIHATEPSNASRTLCFHLTKKQFNKDLCKKLKIPTEIWPEVYPSVGNFGATLNVPGLPDGIPITGILGDQQAALLGQACIQEGSAKCTFGTGAFLLMNTGDKPIKSQHRLLSTVAWALDSENYTYALEGSAFAAGAAVQWIRDGLGWIKDSTEIEVLAQSVSSTEGVVFIPALAGLGAPHWDPLATGMFTGLTRGTTQAHMARAVLEGIAFQNVDILSSMEKDLGRSLQILHVDGGASANQLLMQFQSNILGVQLKKPQFLESTSLGAIFAAGLGLGVWKNFSEIQKIWKEDCSFHPQWNSEERKLHLKRWHRAMRQCSSH